MESYADSTARVYINIYIYNNCTLWDIDWKWVFLFAEGSLKLTIRTSSIIEVSLDDIFRWYKT